MKRVLVFFAIIVIMMTVGCSTVQATAPVIVTAFVPTVTFVPSLTPTLTPTVVPTPTLTPVFVAERQKIQAIMEGYGRVDEKYLTDAYWSRINEEILKYGTAKRILTLEYHGDNYNMWDGFYAMTPEQFEIQMRYLLDNDYHFVTAAEMEGFLEGWLTLPARSIILTTDSGYGSTESMPRIISLFSKLEAEYGVSPHMNSFIMTQQMIEDENSLCKGDVCWQTFREALNSGYVSFGTHTETHRNLSILEDSDLVWDLKYSQKRIFDALGINVFSLSWPYENCSKKDKLVSELGIKFAFGGWTRGEDQLFSYANDNMALCLPRLFPPNPDGISNRLKQMTLEQMLQMASGEESPLQ